MSPNRLCKRPFQKDWNQMENACGTPLCSQMTVSMDFETSPQITLSAVR